MCSVQLGPPQKAVSCAASVYTVSLIHTVLYPQCVYHNVHVGNGLFVRLMISSACLCFSSLFVSRTIRLTSPNLNYVIILGVVVIDISVFFYILPAYSMSVQTVFCNVSYSLNLLV